VETRLLLVAISADRGFAEEVSGDVFAVLVVVLGPGPALPPLGLRVGRVAVVGMPRQEKCRNSEIAESGLTARP
jgi:hypothetical protein